jgi:endoglucanase
MTRLELSSCLVLTWALGAACHPATDPPAVSPSAPGSASGSAPPVELVTAAPHERAPSEVVHAAHGSAATSPKGWWDEPYPERFDPASLPKQLDVIGVKGNHFVDSKGATVVFQGVNISDPDKLEQNGHYDRHYFEVIREWGANVVRVPVHPTAWRARGSQAYLELLDRAVRWATELDLYLIVDWHSIGNLVTGLYQHPMYDTTQQETFEFWRSVAYRYRDVPTVAFYELFNEPTIRNGTLGNAPWEQWKALNEEMISIIFAHKGRPIPLVAGFDWAYQLGPIARQPLQSANIGYVSHPYPGKTKAPFEQHWDEAFGFAAQKYPLFITEMGYMSADAPGAHSPAIDDGSYGKRMTDYLAKKGASWTAWCFDPDWPPQLISDWNYTPTASGRHFREVMLARGAAPRP